MSQTRDPSLGSHRWRATAMLALLLVYPCALAATPACEVRAARAQESIPAETVVNWEPVDDQALLIWTLHDSRAHLVELERPVPGLRDAPTVYLLTRDRDPNVSACGHDEVIVPGAGTARIRSIRYLSEKRTAELDQDDRGATRMRMTFT
jgi:hypothetical protein